jgi:hypothetical protein
MKNSYYPHTNSYVERLTDLGFTFEEANNILDWWNPAEHGEWLMTASAEEIREASKDALQ